MCKSILKAIWWDILNSESYLELTFSLLNLFPGDSGNLLRGYALGRAMKSAGQNTKINSGSTINHPKNMTVGDNFLMNTQCVINAAAGLVCGDNVLLGPGVKIWTINHEFMDAEKTINQQGWSKESVSIGHDVWLAANVIVLPGSMIPDGVVIGANSVVTKKTTIEPYHLYVGNPLRKIKKREKLLD